LEVFNPAVNIRIKSQFLKPAVKKKEFDQSYKEVLNEAYNSV